ncbi:MAG: lactonase family protein [Ferruginibacter sp.]
MPARLFFSLLLTFNIAFAQTSARLLIGSYTSASGDGIHVYDFNLATGDNSLVSSIKTSNASYLAVSPDQKKVYAVNENADSTALGTGGSVSSFSFDKNKGSLTAINQQFSYGKHPCYVTIDQSGRWIFLANYSSGTAAMFPVKADGSIDSVKQVIEDEGTGPDKDRQSGPHAHSTVLSPDNKFLFIQDLGIDKILIYRFDKTTGQLSPSTPPFAMSVGGSGPRHLDFHPNGRYAYLVEEMTGTVVAFKYSDGKLDSIQRINALPKDFTGSIGSADIHVSPDGKYLYCSNRGESNSITIFKINAQNGKLAVIGHQSCMGKTPRNFNFDPSGNFLLVANQETDDVVIFKVDKKTGLLTDTGKRIKVKNPVCIKWIAN